MKSYKYKIYHIASKVIDKLLEVIDKSFQTKFYKDKLLKYTNNLYTLTPYQILSVLNYILNSTHTRTRTLFYIIINNIKFNIIYDKKLDYSGMSYPGEFITINIAQCRYGVNEIKSCIIHELVHYFEKDLLGNYHQNDINYDYCINRFELPAFLMEAWFRYYINKNNKKYFRESFKEALAKTLHTFFDDKDADKAYVYYLDKIKNDSLLNKRYGHLI